MSQDSSHEGDTQISQIDNIRLENSLESIERSTQQNFSTRNHKSIFMSPSSTSRDFFNLQIEKRKQVANKKQQLEIENRKLKTFYVMKPKIIKEIKQKLLDEKLEKKRVKKVCQNALAHQTVIVLMKSLWQNFSVRKERRARELRIIWASIIIKIRIKHRLRRQGPMPERFRSIIRQSFLFHTAARQELAVERAKKVMFQFLYDKQKAL